MSLKAKDAPERIYIDMERMHDFSDASRAIVSTEHATNPTENDVLYVRAAFMEEVREVLGSLMARVDVDRLWEQQRQGFGGGSVPEMYDAGLVPDEFLRASALLAKMEGK